MSVNIFHHFFKIPHLQQNKGKYKQTERNQMNPKTNRSNPNTTARAHSSRPTVI
eukprot:m.93905 g.93905  ORF g.93905 m.93905 type:complete len:54 (-) comp12400_c0_seq7:757-918(-)